MVRTRTTLVRVRTVSGMIHARTMCVDQNVPCVDQNDQLSLVLVGWPTGQLGDIGNKTNSAQRKKSKCVKIYKQLKTFK